MIFPDLREEIEDNQELKAFLADHNLNLEIRVPASKHKMTAALANPSPGYQFQWWKNESLKQIDFGFVFHTTDRVRNREAAADLVEPLEAETASQLVLVNETDNNVTVMIRIPGTSNDAADNRIVALLTDWFLRRTVPRISRRAR